MKSFVTFRKLPYERPDPTRLARVSRRLSRQAKYTVAAKFRELANDFTDQVTEWESMENLCYLHCAEKNPEPFWLEEKAFFESNREHIYKTIRTTLFEIARNQRDFDWESVGETALLNEALAQAQIYSESLPEHMAREAELEAEAARLFNDFTVTVERPEATEISDSPARKEYNIANLRDALRDPDRQYRESFLAVLPRAAEPVETEFSRCYDALVRERREMARAADMAYVDFNLKSRRQIDYTAENLQDFCHDVLDAFSPIIAEMRRLQTRRLNTDRITLMNADFMIPEGDVSCDQSAEAMIPEFFSRLQKMIGEGAEQLGLLMRTGYCSFDDMFRARYGNRKRILPKWQKVYLNLPLFKQPFPLAKLHHHIGLSLSDLAGVLNFQGLRAYEQPDVIRETCGIALVFLGYRDADVFYDQYTDLYYEMFLTRLVMNLPEACMRHLFESRVYGKAEKNADYAAMWAELRRKYDQQIELTPFFENGGDWFLDMDLFDRPLSSLNRVLALITILAERPHRDRRNRLEKKLNLLLTSNPNLPILNRLEHAGFASPFASETLKLAAFTVCDILNL